MLSGESAPALCQAYVSESRQCPTPSVGLGLLSSHGVCIRISLLNIKHYSIRRAHEAQWRPGFYAQLGMDPGNLFCTGIEALKERYDNKGDVW